MRPNRVGHGFVAITVDEEAPDLRLPEAREPADPPAGDMLGTRRERTLDLVLRLEVLGAAGHDDLGLAGRRLDEGVEVLGGALVGNAQGQLVEAVEKERDAALLEHVAKSLEVDAVFPGPDEVLGDELIQGAGLLEAAHLDEHRGRALAARREPQRQHVQEEALAGAEVAEQEDEARFRLGQPLHDRGQGILGIGTIPAHLAIHALVDIKRGRVDGIVLQPAGLALQVGAEVDEPLILDEAHDPHPMAPGLVDQGSRRAIRGGINDPRYHAGIGASVGPVDLGQEVREVLGGEATVRHTDRVQVAMRAVGLRDPEVVDPLGLHSGDRGAGLPDTADLFDPAQQVVTARNELRNSFLMQAPADKAAPLIGRGRVANWKRAGDRVERNRDFGDPSIALLRAAVVSDPALAARVVAARVALNAIRVEPQHRVLVRDLLRPRLGGDGGAAGREDGHVAIEPVDLALVRMAVQQKIKEPTEVTAEVVGIVQGLVVARHAALVVVVHHA